MVTAELLDLADRAFSALAAASGQQLALGGLLVAALAALAYVLADAWRYSRIPSIDVALKPGVGVLAAGSCLLVGFGGFGRERKRRDCDAARSAVCALGGQRLGRRCRCRRLRNRRNRRDAIINHCC